MKMKSVVNFINFADSFADSTSPKNLTARRRKSRHGKWHSSIKESEMARECYNGMEVIFRRYYAIGIHKAVKNKIYCWEEIVVKSGDSNSFGTIKKNPDGEIVLSAHHKYARKACWKDVCCKGKIPAALQADKRILPTLFALMKEKWAGQELYCMPSDSRRDGIYVKALKRAGAHISEHSEYALRFEF